MDRIECLKLPENLRLAPKNEVLAYFINVNMFLWTNKLMYSRKMFDILKSVIVSTDSNNTTWWKLWYRSMASVADTLNLSYLKYTCEKYVETVGERTAESLAEDFLQFDLLLIKNSNMSFFQGIEAILSIYPDNSIASGIYNFYDRKSAIHEIFDEMIPPEAYNKSMIRAIVGEDINKNFKDIDYSNILKEFVYREAIGGEKVKREHLKTVITHILTNKYIKAHPTLVDDVWTRIQNIKEEKKDEKDDE